MTKRLAFPVLLGLLGAAMLAGLGVWQVQRLEWKREVLAAMDERIHSAPVPLPAVPDRDRDRYLSVEVSGRVSGPELLVLASRRGFGPGFRIIVAFETSGRRILLDRGFVPERLRDAERVATETAVVGNLLWPDEKDRLFTPEPDGNLWFAREVDAMAAALETEPVLVVARNASVSDPGVHRWPVDGFEIPNDHLEYAITWFSLAAVWVGMTAFWVWRIVRRAEGQEIGSG